MIAKVIHGGGGGGASGLPGYIAERDRDEALEGPSERPLFSGTPDRAVDDLDVPAANAVLAGQGNTAERDDLFHLVVGLTDKEFEALGDTNDERSAALRDAVRDAVAALERELGLEDVRFIAGIHLNTDNPHVHIALAKDAFDRETGESVRLERLPASLFPEKSAPGEAPDPSRTPPDAEPGRTLVEIFEAARARHEAPIRFVAFTSSENGRGAIRALVDEGVRPPTEQERLVGRYVTLESLPTRVRDDGERRELRALRDFVRRLDAEAERDGRTARAYIPKEQLRDLIARNQLTPLDAHGGEREPYHARADVHEQNRLRERSGSGAPEPERPESPRAILGRELELRLTIEHLEWRLAASERYETSRRVLVPDPAHGGAPRPMSVRDIEQRAGARARAEAGTEAARTPSDREAIREDAYTRALAPHGNALLTIASRSRGLDAYLSKSLATARDDLRRLAPEAHSARATLRQAGLEPTPTVEPAAISRMQEEAFVRGDAKTLARLEALRPPDSRSREDLGRLAALTTIADVERRVAERRATDFESSRHTRRFDVDGRKHSLASVDTRDRNLEREAAYSRGRAGALAARLGRAKPWTARAAMMGTKTATLVERAHEFQKRAETAERAREDNGRLRSEIVDHIGAERARHAGELSRTGDLASTLYEIARREHASPRSGAEHPQLQFSTRELERLEANALILRDARLLAVVDEARERDPATRAEDRAARASGRALAADVERRSAQELSAGYAERAHTIPVLYTDRNGADRTMAPSDLAPRSWWDRLTRGTFASRDERERRSAVTACVAETTHRLGRDQAELDRFAASASTIATEHERVLASLGREIPKLALTPREAIRIETFAESTRDPLARAELRGAISDALRDGRIRDLAHRDRSEGRSIGDASRARSRDISAPRMDRSDHERDGRRGPASPATPDRARTPGTGSPAAPRSPARTEEPAKTRERAHDFGRGR